MGKPTWFGKRKYEFDIDKRYIKNYLMKCGSFEFDMTIEEVDELVEKINQGVKNREMEVLRERFKNFSV